MKHFKRALITGATSGIGEALAHLLANQKIDLILTGRDSNKLTALTEQLKQKVSVISLVANLSTAEGLKQLRQIIEKETPDLVINNAGFGLYGEACLLSFEKQKEMIGLNCSALMELTLSAAKHLKTTGKAGTICNIGSAAAFISAPQMAVYSATKAFVASFSKSLDFELQPYNIRVLISSPGMVSTNFAARAGGKQYSPNQMTMTPEYAAKKIWQQIQQGKRSEVFDWRYRISTLLAQLLPDSFSAKWVGDSIKERLRIKQ